ncbi:MAG: citrate lyase subunit alpha [Pyramidobacter sp.]|jgi:citrate lyase subunit alpha/citrate CoA-transferase
MKDSKVVSSLKDAILRSRLKDGMRISFHHHLRNGDGVMNMVLAQLASMGFRGLTLNSSSVFDVQKPLVEHIKNGVISRIETNYMGSEVGRFISEGGMKEPVIFRSHGGRPSAIERGITPIDVAFIAAPAADSMGNATGSLGKSACGSLGYAEADARCAAHSIVITDTLVPYPLEKAIIQEQWIDSVVVVDSIGDPKGIVSGTTRLTRDPVALAMAATTVDVIRASGLLKDGFSFQTGAGGASLAAATFLKKVMLDEKIQGSFALGGITGAIVDMLDAGCFRSIMDVQCFDLAAVASIRDNPHHVEISASRYASPTAKSCCVDSLDAAILGATEIDTDFNVNVHTDSNGLIMGGSGGHSDVAAGAKLCIVVAPLIRARLPIVSDRVTTISTPGRTVDVLVTQKGVAVNPARGDLRDRLADAGLKIVDIHDLKSMAEKLTGVPHRPAAGTREVAKVLYRDEHVIDTIRSVE